jgi:hypothetical protein
VAQGTEETLLFVCLRTREASSFNQFTGFNGENVKGFFENFV